MKGRYILREVNLIFIPKDIDENELDDDDVSDGDYFRDRDVRLI
jgi:hypothetical protein